MNDLRIIKEFKTSEEYKETKELIERLVQDGVLQELGLDSSESYRFVEKYISNEGEIWLLALPDQAFRGYLKKKSDY